MNILKSETKLVDNLKAYEMISGRNSKSISDLWGQKVNVDAYVIFEDGDTVVLSIMCDNVIYSTNSKTFIRDFEGIVEFLKFEPVFCIEVCMGKSKNNRNFSYCMPAGQL